MRIALIAMRFVPHHILRSHLHHFPISADALFNTNVSVLRSARWEDSGRGHSGPMAMNLSPVVAAVHSRWSAPFAAETSTAALVRSSRSPSTVRSVLEAAEFRALASHAISAVNAVAQIDHRHV